MSPKEPSRELVLRSSYSEEDWDARNLLYSLRFNIGTAILIPGCNQRQVVFDDTTELCKMFCSADLRSENEKYDIAEEEKSEEQEEMKHG